VDNNDTKYNKTPFNDDLLSLYIIYSKLMIIIPTDIDNLQNKMGVQDKRCVRLPLWCLILSTLSSAYIIFFSSSSQTPHVRRLQLWPKVIEYHETNERDGRPVMHTFFFFETIDKSNGEVLAELDNWKNAWSEAGWRPVVLTLEDAKRHNDYQHYHDTFMKAEYKIDQYNRMRFYRWLAMAVAGGGWMSDLDTFPLFSNPEIDGKILPNQGKFTCYSRHIPNLVSGSRSEFERISKILFNSYSMHLNEFWSDINAMLESNRFLKNYYDLDDSLSLERFYEKEFQEEKVKEIVHPYDLASKCEYAVGKRVVHFSHADCHKVGFCDRERKISVPIWIQEFREKCTVHINEITS